MASFLPKAKPARIAMIALLVLAPISIVWSLFAGYFCSDFGVKVSNTATIILVTASLILAGWRAREKREEERQAKTEREAVSAHAE